MQVSNLFHCIHVWIQPYILYFRDPCITIPFNMPGSNEIPETCWSPFQINPNIQLGEVIDLKHPDYKLTRPLPVVVHAELDVLTLTCPDVPEDSGITMLIDNSNLKQTLKGLRGILIYDYEFATHYDSEEYRNYLQEILEPTSKL